MARTVRDTALMLSVMAGPDPRVPISLDEPGTVFADAAEGGVSGLRVAWSPDLGIGRVEPEVARIVERTARRFGEVGCTVQDAHPEIGEIRPMVAAFRALGVAANSPHLLDKAEQVDNPFLREFLKRPHELSGLDLARAFNAHSRLTERVAAFFDRYDLLITPTTPTAAYLLDEMYPPEIDGRAGRQCDRRDDRDLRNHNGGAAGDLGAGGLLRGGLAGRDADRRGSPRRGAGAAGRCRLRGHRSLVRPPSTGRCPIIMLLGATHGTRSHRDRGRCAYRVLRSVATSDVIAVRRCRGRLFAAGTATSTSWSIRDLAMSRLAFFTMQDELLVDPRTARGPQSRASSSVIREPVLSEADVLKLSRSDPVRQSLRHMLEHAMQKLSPSVLSGRVQGALRRIVCASCGQPSA